MEHDQVGHYDRAARGARLAAGGVDAAGLETRPRAAAFAVLRLLRLIGRSVVAPLTTLDPGENPPSEVADGQRRFGRWQLLDIAVPVVLYAVTAVSFVSAGEALGSQYPPQLMHLLAAGCCLPVALRRRWPMMAWQVTWLAVVVTSGWFSLLFADAQFVPGQVIAYLVCLYTLASRARPTIAVGAWLWSLAGIVIIATVDLSPQPQNAALWAWSVLLVTVPPLFGYNVRARRRAQADLEVQQVRNEQEQAARAVLEERSRIARELHDVVAHNMSVIAIQAEAAPLRVPGDVHALEAELAGIRATALQTLVEMRRILGVLRDRDGQSETAPTPGIDQLVGLVEKVGAAGMDVRMTVEGSRRQIPPGVGVSIYRIVQESLSNALRHAPGAAVTVQLIYRDAPPALGVRIENGPAPSALPPDEWRGARHGLVGMRERVAMLRGTLTAEPTANGGFVVDATLPLEET